MAAYGTKEYFRERNARPNQVKNRKSYESSDKGKAARRDAAERHRKRYPHKIKARAKAQSAGSKSCSRCGGGSAEAHHTSYDPPKVTWLCKKCHEGTHPKKGKAKGAGKLHKSLLIGGHATPAEFVDKFYGTALYEQAIDVETRFLQAKQKLDAAHIKAEKTARAQMSKLDAEQRQLNKKRDAVYRPVDDHYKELHLLREEYEQERGKLEILLLQERKKDHKMSKSLHEIATSIYSINLDEALPTLVKAGGLDPDAMERKENGEQDKPDHDPARKGMEKGAGDVVRTQGQEAFAATAPMAGGNNAVSTNPPEGSGSFPPPQYNKGPFVGHQADPAPAQVRTLTDDNPKITSQMSQGADATAAFQANQGTAKVEALINARYGTGPLAKSQDQVAADRQRAMLEQAQATAQQQAEGQQFLDAIPAAQPYRMGSVTFHRAAETDMTKALMANNANMHRAADQAPTRQCHNCGSAQHLMVSVCSLCGADASQARGFSTLQASGGFQLDSAITKSIQPEKAPTVTVGGVNYVTRQ